MTESAQHSAPETSDVSASGVADVRLPAPSPTESTTIGMESINVTAGGHATAIDAPHGINGNATEAALMPPPAASPSLPPSGLSLGAPSASPPLFGHHLSVNNSSSAPPTAPSSSAFDSASHFLGESPAIGQRTLLPPTHDDAPLLSPGMSTSQLQASPFGSPSGLSPGMFLPGIDDSAKSISRYRVLQPNANGAANQADTQSANAGSDLHLLSTPSLPSSTLFTPGPQYQSLGMGSPAMGIMSRFDSSPGATLRSLRMTPNSTNMVMPIPSPPSSSTTLGRGGLPPLAPQPAQAGGAFPTSNTNILNPTPLQPSSGGLLSSQTASALQSAAQAPLLPPAPLSQSTVSMDAFPSQSPTSPPAMTQSAAINSQQLANSLQQTKQLMQALSNVQAQSQQQQQQHLQSQQQVTQLQLQLQLQMQLSQQLQQQLQLQQQQIAANAAHSYPPLPNQPFPTSGSPNQFNNMPNGNPPGGYQQGSPTMPTKTLGGGAPNNTGVYHDMNMNVNHMQTSYQSSYGNFNNDINFNPNVPSPNSGNHHINMGLNKQQVQNPGYGQAPVLASMKTKVQSPNGTASVVPATTVAVVKPEKVKTPLKAEKAVKDFPDKQGDPSSMPATSTPTGGPASKKRERSTSEPATGDAGDESGDDSEEEDSDSEKEDGEDDGPPELDADGNPIPRKKKIAGSSCHQCKTRRVGDELIYCGMSHAKKGRAKKRKAERKCRKKYCSRCLHKFYHEAPPPKPAPGEPNTWSCPGCRGLCTCAACKRTQQRREAKRKKQLAAQQGHPIPHVAHAHHVVPGHPQPAYAMPHHPHHMPNPMMHQGGGPGYDNMGMPQMPYGHSGHMPMQDYNNPSMSPNGMNPPNSMQGNMRGSMPPNMQGGHMNSSINSPPMYHPQQQSQMHPQGHHFSQPPINSPPQMTHSLFNNHNSANGPSGGNNPAYSPQGYMHQSYPSPSFQQPSHLLSPNGLGYRTLGPQPTGNSSMPFVPTPTLPTHSLQAYGNGNGPTANGNKLPAPMPSPPMTYSSLALSPQGIQTRGLPPTVTQMGMPNMPSILHSHDAAQQHNASQPTPAAIGVAVAAANNSQRPDLL